MYPDIVSSYATAEYRLVIEPPEPMRESLGKVKKYFAETYDCSSAAIGKPNITLLRFEQYEMIEQRIVRRMQLLASEHASFLVALNGFGSFPSHTIFFSITAQTQLAALIRSFRPIRQLLKIDKERKPHYINEPYITLATKLLPWQYEKGWLEMSNTHFSGKFIAEQLVLLRKKQGEKRYEVVRKFLLKNEKVNTVQGALF